MSSAVPSTRKPITVWLDSAYNTTEPEFYRCSRCGMVVVEFLGRQVMEVPGRSPVLPSVIVKCKGNYRRKNNTWEECGRLYSFAGVVFTDNPMMD